MEFNEIIKSKIDRLIGIKMMPGVKPSDLANNIFINDYKSISFNKIDNKILGIIVFEEVIDGVLRETILRYTYNESMVLMRVEEIKEQNIIIQWDRDLIESELINDIVMLIKDNFSENQALDFINTLPQDLKSKVENYYIKVA